MRALFFLACSLLTGFMLSAQTPQLPTFHGGNPNRTLDIKNPENTTLRPDLRYDFSRNNPNFRSAQPRVRSCATEEMEADRQAKHASETESAEEFEQFIEQSIQQMQQSRSLRRVAKGIGVYTLPTVVHVIYSSPIENITDEQVLSQIQVLNEDYRRQNPDRINTPREFKRFAADTEIEFCLATVDPSGNPTDGIDRISMSGAPFKERYINEVIKPSTIWDPDRYFNIWVINIAGGILGFAQFPSSSGLTGLPEANGTRVTDGVVINFNVFGTTGTVAPPFDRGRTATHEIGHWMGLRHVWGDGPCGIDDFCEDTPETSGAHYSCPPSVVGCSGDRAMIQNFMDYTDDACMSLFTLDQKIRMRAVLENSPRRKTLLNAASCKAIADPPKPAFAADISIGCAPLKVSFTDQSEGEQLRYNWSFPGGKPATSDDPNPQVVYRKPGMYPVSLRVSNPGGTRTTEQSGLVQVIEAGIPLPVSLDFEQGENFPPLGFQVYNPHQDQGWDLTPRVSADGVGNGAMVINNYDNNFMGSDDWLVSPILDLSDSKGTTIAFDVAYAPFDGKYSDTLGVFISTGCETTYRNIYYKGGELLSTAAPYNRPFLPRADEWRKELIDLRAYDGEPYVQIVIVGFSGYGNDLFLDNINLYAAGEAAPQAGFYAEESIVCAGSQVKFTDQSLNQPTRWVWSFPGGTPASDTVSNPEITYKNPGTYDVILTVYNEGGEDTHILENYVTVNAGPSLALATSSTRICEGESVTLQAQSEGSLQWDLGTEAPVLNQRKLDLKPLQDATYTAIATGSNGCSARKSVTVRVEQGRKLAITPPSATICAGSEVTLQATGADSYEWVPAEGLSNTTSSLVRAAPERTTSYEVIGTTRSGCRFKGEVTVDVQEAPVDFQVVVSRDEICPGEQTELQARGAAAFSWSPALGLNRTEGDVVVAAPTRTTTYRVSALTENGCSAERPITISVSEQPVVTAFADVYEVCPGESVNLTAGGTDYFSWAPAEDLLSRSGPTVEATPTMPTTFVVTGTNQVGCTDTAQIRIGIREAAPVEAIASPSSICPGEEVLLQASGGIRYQWYLEDGSRLSRSEQLRARPRNSQTFRVLSVDEAGCEAEAEVLVEVSDGKRPVADFVVENELTCAGQEVQFTNKSLGAVGYRWEFPTGIPSTSTEANPKVRFLDEGLHDVVLTVTGCEGGTDRKEEIGLIVTTPPVRISLNASDETLCQGSPYRLVARGASSYQWEPAPGLSATTGKSVIVRPSEMTTYRVIGTDADGCQGRAQVTFNVVGSGKRSSVSPFAPVICEGESVTLQAEGALSYSWTPQRGLNRYNTAIVEASPKTTTAYVVESTDIDGCTFRDTVVVKVQPKANLEILADKASLCAGEKTGLRIKQTGIFTWSPAEGLSGTTGTQLEAFPAQTTTYTVRGTDQQGCKMQGEIEIRVGRQANFTVSAQDEEICPGEGTILTAKGGSNYKWYPATGLDRDNGAIVSATPTETTTYTVTSGEGGCGNEQSVTVVVKPDRPLVIEPAAPRICAGSSLDLTAKGGKAYIWDAAEGLNTVAGAKVSVTPTQTTSYQVFAINEQGCQTNGSVTVVVDNASFLRLSASQGKVCAGSPVELNVTGAESYEWLEGLPAGAHARTLTRPDVKTTYRVAGVNSVGCRDTATISLEVGELEGDFDMTAMRVDLAKESGLVHFNDLTEGAQEWLWRFSEEGVSRDANPSYVFTKPGTYPVTLLVSDGVCVDTVQREVVVENSSSLQDIADGGAIQIKPTNKPGSVILDLDSPREMYLQMRVMSQEGTEVLASNIRLPAGTYQQQLDLTRFPKGTYHVQLSDGMEMLSRKIAVD